MGGIEGARPLPLGGVEDIGDGRLVDEVVHRPDGVLDLSVPLEEALCAAIEHQGELQDEGLLRYWTERFSTAKRKPLAGLSSSCSQRSTRTTTP